MSFVGKHLRERPILDEMCRLHAQAKDFAAEGSCDPVKQDTPKRMECILERVRDLRDELGNANAGVVAIVQRLGLPSDGRVSSNGSEKGDGLLGELEGEIALCFSALGDILAHIRSLETLA